MATAERTRRCAHRHERKPASEERVRRVSHLNLDRIPIGRVMEEGINTPYRLAKSAKNGCSVS
jgi:hypothetical protein